MHLFNLDLPLNFVIVFGIILSIIIAVITLKVVSAIRSALKARRQKKTNIAAIAEEEVRISKLPKLSTRYLIKIPASVSNFANGEPRTFGNRYNRLIVFDENGDGWLGLFMPETFQGLHVGEYIQENYWVPFRGDGEMYAGEPVKIDGKTIHIYPIWMNADNMNTVDWAKWAQLEKAFAKAYHTTSYLDDFHQNTPFERTRQLSEERRAFAGMKTSIA
jgi:hypothetical protein